MKVLLTFARQPLRKRLWLGGCAVGLVLAVFVVHETIVRCTDGSHRLALGQDLLPVYAAGTLVREGRSRQLYAIDPLARVEQRVVREADLEPLPVYGAFLNPPHFAAAFAPLSAFSYRQASLVWLATNLLLMAASLVLLCRMLPPGSPWQTWGLVPLLVILPLPFWQALCHQQNSFLSLLILCLTVILWRRAWRDQQMVDERGSSRRHGGWAWAAGALTGLLFYKPQLATLVAAVMVATLGWRALAGLAAVGTLTLIAMLAALPGTLGAYLHQLGPMLQLIQVKLHYNWARQVTPQSFWRLLIQGDAGGATAPLPRILAIATSAIAALGVAAAVLRLLRRHSISIDAVIAATITSMPLIMPYFMDYDLLLLAVPAVLLASQWHGTATHSSKDRTLLWAWGLLFMASYFNPGLGTVAKLNLDVPLIGAIACLSIARCFTAEVARSPVNDYDALPLAAAA